MNDRVSTPDILGNIMSSEGVNKAIKQETPKEIKKTAPKPQPEEEIGRAHV